jgi:SAM-dependent methyltransferase
MGKSKVSRVYSNHGNKPVIDLVNPDCQRVLDIGCGAGDNAALLKSLYPTCEVFGITHSAAEAEIARHYMKHCWVFDIEEPLPVDLSNLKFDVLIFSHILEHLRNPATELSKFLKILDYKGTVLIAVPNILSWRQRIQFLFGCFQYESAGVLDDTHLRFFTYFTADQYLLAQSPELELQFKGVTGSVPLWLLRRFVLPKNWSDMLDKWGCRYWPNLFGGQILIKAKKK